jgi:serine protease Do
MEVDGKKLTTSRDLTSLAAKLGVGDTVKVTVLRDGRQKVLDVKVAKRPLTMAAASNHQQQEKEGEYGFQVTELTPQVAQRYNIKETTGVIVIGVEPNSKAQAAGIQQGDLIIEVNRKNVESVKDFKNLIEQHKKSDGINLLVKRMNGGLMVIHLA